MQDGAQRYMMLAATTQDAGAPLSSDRVALQDRGADKSGGGGARCRVSSVAWQAALLHGRHRAQHLRSQGGVAHTDGTARFKAAKNNEGWQ